VLTKAGSGLGSLLDIETFFRGDVRRHDSGGKLFLGSIFSEMIAFYPLYPIFNYCIREQDIIVAAI
jgi:hypothetical protein